MPLLHEKWKIISQVFGITGEIIYQVARLDDNNETEYGMGEWVFSFDKAYKACERLNKGAPAPV